MPSYDIFCKAGSYGDIMGAKNADMINSNIKNSEITANLFFLNFFHISLKLDLSMFIFLFF